jgi:phage repressor protein C with HTH and peptisase S24 domain
VRKGDRVVVRTGHGEMMAKEFKRKTAKTFELKSFNSHQAERILPIEDVLWAARIVWATQ